MERDQAKNKKWVFAEPIEECFGLLKRDFGNNH
jgi:hypothetical protein